MASNTAMYGVINAAGQMQINFTQTNGDVTIALGNYRDVGGTNLIEMQMLSQVATAQNITHWAYMAPYTGANYPTNTPTNPSLLATNWAWMQGTTWNIEDDSLFGTNGSGTFSVSIFNSGYFWGDGSSATNGDFTLIGSATPEGNLILGLLNTQTGVQTSLFGDITGDATNSLMSLSTFTTNGITPGPPAATAALIPGSIANLSVTNGAALYLTNGINSYAYTYVGNAANDSNNVLAVANASTLLTNSQNLYLGNGGSDNTMVITNGAMVAGRSGFIGYDASSSNNSVVVTGSNSVWSSSADLFVGYSGSSNSLIITNSAKVIASNTYISSFGGSNNSVQVSGPGSTLSNSGSISVGASPILGLAGAGTLTITSDGTVAASRLIISGSTDSIGTVEVGLKGGSDSNMTLDVPEIIFGEGTGSLGLNQSDTLTISGSISGAMATNSYAMIQQYGSGTTILTGISHTGLGYRVDGGQLMVNGGIFDIYLNAGISPNELGGPRTVTIGNKNSGISLVVTNSGELHSFVTIIGTDLIKNSDSLTTSSNNWALVTGPGSKLIAGELQIGNVSSGNSLVISNGATVSSALASSIGISGSNNSVTVTGSGSLFTNAGSLTVGTYSQSYVAAANRLLVTNGSGLFSDSAMIGATTNSFGNAVTVTGAGSFWTNSGALYVGNGGSGNMLTVSSGAIVAVGGGTNGTVLGFGAGSSNNSVLVTGSNTSLSITKALFVGYGGSGNTLTISNGASVTVTCTGDGDYLSLGENGGSSNTLTVTGASTLTVNAGAQSLYGIWIGDSDGSSNNRMVVSDGGRVYSTGESGIGCVEQSGDTEALITGAGSLWTNNGVLAIGARDGGNGVVTVANGGTLAATEIKIANLTNTSAGTLNIGSLGGSDTAGTIISPTIAFGAGTGAINFNQSDSLNMTSSISGAGTVNQLGAGTTTLSGSNSYTGSTTISGGTLRLGDENAAGASLIIQTTLASLVEFLGGGQMTNDMTVFQYSFANSFEAAGQVTLADATSSIAVASGQTVTGSGSFIGSGGLTKRGFGALALTASNNFSGPISVESGTLELASLTGSAAGFASSVSVSSGATLLVSQSDQVNNSATVTLSGGTITRGSGVSEVFGNLNVTQASFLDFGGGAGGTITFSGLSYTPSALLSLQLVNFTQGNSLVIQSTTDLSGYINTGFTFGGSGGFGSSSFSNNTFTISAIPEPSTYVAAIGLLALMLWPLRHRLRGKVS